MIDNPCPCCPPDVRAERADLGLPPCRSQAAGRVVGFMSFEHKTAPALTVGSRESISKLTRNDRRRDHRFQLTRA